MSLKFRLKGLAETFVEKIKCCKCGHDGGEEGDRGFNTQLTRVTYEGIVVVIECEHCGQIFVPDGQRKGIINSKRLEIAVRHDSQSTGQPVLTSLKDVKLDVEKLNAIKNNELQ